jgi:hypothetical protein
MRIRTSGSGEAPVIEVGGKVIEVAEGHLA